MEAGRSVSGKGAVQVGKMRVAPRQQLLNYPSSIKMTICTSISDSASCSATSVAIRAPSECPATTHGPCGYSATICSMIHAATAGTESRGVSYTSQPAPASQHQQRPHVRPHLMQYGLGLAGSTSARPQSPQLAARSRRQPRWSLSRARGRARRIQRHRCGCPGSGNTACL